MTSVGSSSPTVAGVKSAKPTSAFISERVFRTRRNRRRICRGMSSRGETQPESDSGCFASRLPQHSHDSTAAPPEMIGFFGPLSADDSHRHLYSGVCPALDRAETVRRIHRVGAVRSRGGSRSPCKARSVAAFPESDAADSVAQPVPARGSRKRSQERQQKRLPRESGCGNA